MVDYLVRSDVMVVLVLLGVYSQCSHNSTSLLPSTSTQRVHHTS